LLIGVSPDTSWRGLRGDGARKIAVLVFAVMRAMAVSEWSAGQALVEHVCNKRCRGATRVSVCEGDAG
jgi:hypothetical protein